MGFLGGTTVVKPRARREQRRIAQQHRTATIEGDVSGRHIVFASWRDAGNPEGGGAEHYLHRIASGLVDRGARVTIVTAAYPGASAHETVDGITYRRAGGKLSVYLRTMQTVATARLPGGIGRADAVIDIQNGLPFFTRLVTTSPITVLVHHIHREQWPVVYPGRTGVFGWWIESKFAPRLYRRCPYITVSQATKSELVELGIDADRISVVHNGSDAAVGVLPSISTEPSIAVVGRLVPHKRVELAIDAICELRKEFPKLTLNVVGSGWWEDELRAYAAQCPAPNAISFSGFVSDEELSEIYRRAWALALPSLKEGWGLVVSEAARYGTPTVAFRSAGGTQESVADGESGLLVDEVNEFTEALRVIVGDDAERLRLSYGALAHAGEHTWERSINAFAAEVANQLAARR